MAFFPRAANVNVKQRRRLRLRYVPCSLSPFSLARAGQPRVRSASIIVIKPAGQGRSITVQRLALGEKGGWSNE
ncbi:hypothetical protein CC78DRAFT_532760 [Lojkania enalia]|uniref:Uncharacterized protein n=1 Tax=Lojkania enalia TaxID=147567 RepID=A0A9P4KAI7_9PLEO|nr:hypothetical protein CC78DRAFT_532760 [Didymosphaeria enalia]